MKPTKDIMEKNLRRRYERPVTEVVTSYGKPLMVTASPGVKGSYHDGMDIDARENIFFDDDYSWSTWED